MARKGQFKKGGGHVGDGRTRSRSRSKSRRTTAIVVVPPAGRATHRRRGTRPHHKATTHRRRRGSGSGGVTVAKLAGTALVLANVAGTNSGPLGSKVYDLVQKIPGTKTFGGAATAGLTLGAIGKFTGFGGRFRPWLRAAGWVGVIAAFLKLGEQGTAFKWVGDDDVMDVEA
jgi:hypothetical protein